MQTNATFLFSACNNSACSYQNGLGLTYFCSPGCSLILLENGYCDEACNTASCNYDNNSCLCSIGCTPSVLASTTCYSNDPCLNSACSYKNGVCGTCAANCFDSMVGNGICESSCNNANCNYDGGDCSCAPGCDSTYENGVWNHVGECQEECLVEACHFNYNSCNDSTKIIGGILNSLI